MGILGCVSFSTTDLVIMGLVLLSVPLSFVGGWVLVFKGVKGREIEAAYEYCVGCGYNLHMLVGGDCPECGVDVFDGTNRRRYVAGVGKKRLIGGMLIVVVSGGLMLQLVLRVFTFEVDLMVDLSLVLGAFDFDYLTMLGCGFMPVFCLGVVTVWYSIWRKGKDSPYRLCPKCRYNLHMLKSHECPECGEFVRNVEVRKSYGGTNAKNDMIIGDCVYCDFVGWGFDFVVWLAGLF